MTCTECQEPMHSDGGESTTLVGYGGIQSCGGEHDDNCRKRIYWCKNKHHAIISIQRTCSKCDWKGKLTCFCHAGEKVQEWP